MKKALLLLTNIAVTFIALAQTPTVKWAKSMGGKGSDVGTSLAIDKEGNIYTTGVFSDTVDFDPGEGVTKLIAEEGGSSFVTKFDSSGNFLWGRSSGIEDYTRSIVIDSKGYIYTTGSLTVRSTFQGSQTTLFVTKWDNAGNLIFTKHMDDWGEPSNANPYPFCYGTSIDIDAADNIYITGTFGGEFNFDPNYFDKHKLKSTGYNDGFILKLNNNGTFIWVNQFTNKEGLPYKNMNWCTSLKISTDGYIYLTGCFRGKVDFNPSLDTFNLTSDTNSLSTFLIKLNIAGDFIWAKGIGGFNRTEVSANSVAIDDLGNVYITGIFSGSADFDPSNAVYTLTTDDTSNGGIRKSAIFISKTDKEGNFIWAKNMKGNGVGSGRSIFVTKHGDVFTLGIYQGTLDFDPNDGTQELTSKTGQYNGSNFQGNVFISKLDMDGNFVWAKSLGDTSNADASSIVLDEMGNIYTFGFYEGKMSINNTILTSLGKSDIYLFKLYDPIILGLKEKEHNYESFINLFPNPTNGTIVVFVPNSIVSASIEVYNSFGVLVHTQSVVSERNILSITNQADGLYVIKVSGGGKTFSTQKIIKQ